MTRQMGIFATMGSEGTAQRGSRYPAGACVVLTCALLATACTHEQRVIPDEDVDTHAASLQLASNGAPLMKIVTRGCPPPRETESCAAPEVQAAAEALRVKLSAITGAQFVTGGSTNGSAEIAVGLGDDFPRTSVWRFGGTYFGTPGDPLRSEDYAISTHAAGICLAAATVKGISHAVWDLLFQMGYRQFFPGQAWEVLPSSPELSVQHSRLERPSYYDRELFFGWGPWWDRTVAWAEWRAKNRMSSGLSVETSHSYGAIIKRNQAVFEANPGYMAVVDGVPTPPIRNGNVNSRAKFRISNPDLRAFVVEDSKREFNVANSPRSITLSPSDGRGWDESTDVMAFASITDRALTLANQVATEIDTIYPGQKYIGMYAYDQHAPPPIALTVHPRVSIFVATEFVPQRPEALIAGWQAKGAELMGIRDFYSVWSVDRDFPGQSRAADLTYLRTKIPDFHARGLRLAVIESADGWGLSGLGHYLASRYLWNVADAATMKYENDFFTKAFGPAAPKLVEFYGVLDPKNRPLLSTHLINQMYTKLRQGLDLAVGNTAVRRRIYDLALYVRYLELMRDYLYTADDTEQQAKFETLARFVYRIRETYMVNSLALWRGNFKLMPAPFNTNEGFKALNHPWKNSVPLGEAPYTAEEIAEIEGLITAGMDVNQNPVFTWEPKSFSQDLVPAGAMITQSYSLPRAYQTHRGTYLDFRGDQNAYVWLNQPGTLDLQATRIHTATSDAEVSLFAMDNPNPTEVLSSEVFPAAEGTYAMSLSSRFSGLHRVAVTGKGMHVKIEWPVGTSGVFPVGSDEPTPLLGRIVMYFYVPKGTTTVGLFASGDCQVQNGSGVEVLDTEREPAYYGIPVASGQDGKIWRFTNCAARPILMTVPPYVAFTPQELMLPAEVRQADFNQ